MKRMNPFRMGLAATLGISALLIGVTASAPARADDWEGYGRNHIYRDIQDVRRDERILRNLEDRRDDARRHHDWSEVRRLDRRISDLRRHIDKDKRDIRRDIGRSRDDRYRDETRYRVHDRNDDYRYRR